MRLEWMLLANHAEVNSGLLYVSGGGWDTITVQGPLTGGPPGAFALLQGTLVIRLLFHPTEAGREHGFVVTIIDEDGAEIRRAEGNVTVPKVAGLPLGWQQNVNLTIPVTGVALPRPGLYTVSLQVDDQHVGDRPFRVVKGYDG